VLLFLALSYAGASRSALAQTALHESQTSPTSSSGAGSVAAAAKTKKPAHTAKVFTDEDMEVRKNPLPELNLEGDDNSDEVLAAIAKYKESHKPEETEQVVHDGYEEYDAMLASNAREANQFRTNRESNTYNGYDLCQQSDDYEHCEKRRLSELRGQRMDAITVRNSMQRVGRIQPGLMKIRSGLVLQHLNYSWFKIRNGNGVGSF
jgi:hypothetical protein